MCMIVPDIGKTVINNANLTLVLVEVTFRKSRTTTKLLKNYGNYWGRK